jgi:hypothetical protein
MLTKYYGVPRKNGITGFCPVPRHAIKVEGKAKYGTGRKKPLTSGGYATVQLVI